jgi:hypothetical protein
LVVVLGFLVIAGAVLALLVPLADVPSGMVRLELAGTATRAAEARHGVSDQQVRTALWWDFVFMLGYSAVLICGLLLFPVRVFRVGGWRGFARPAQVVVAVGAGLDVGEDLFVFGALDRQHDWAWAAATAVAWPKFLLLAIVAGYVLIAAGAYLFTPGWVQVQLQKPPPPNVEMRRTPAPPSPEPSGADDEDVRMVDLRAAAIRYGIALSGGGVRSAALVLGSLQQLDAAYPKIDSEGPSWSTAGKVASVSGGSYMAGGWSVSRSARMAGSPAPGPTPDSWQPDSPEQAHLLDRLGYLVAANPSGRAVSKRAKKQSDVPGVVATVGMGLLLNATLLFALLWLLVRPYGWLLKSWLVGCASPSACQLQPQSVTTVLVWTALTALVLLVWVGSGWIRAGCQPDSLWQRIFDWLYSHLRLPMMSLLGITIALALLLVVGPLLVVAVPGWLASGAQYLKPAALLSGIGAVVALARGLAKTSARLAPYVGGALFVLLVVLVSLSWVTQARLDSANLRLWLIVLAAWLLLYTFTSSEWWSLAAFYRGKLRAAFATFRQWKGPFAGTVEAFGNGNAPPETVEPSIYELATRSKTQADGSPLHICATANISTRAVKTHYGLPALSLTISPEMVRLHLPLNETGSWRDYESPAKHIEALLYRRGGMRLTSMMALGLSGAAVSPAMGKFRIGPARALLALANIRLGAWLPNPMYATQSPYAQRPPDRVRPAGPSAVQYPRQRLSYLLKEMFGIFDPSDLYLYVTDGGHWEDTGLVELLRDRDIDEVVCFDADESPRDTVTELAGAIVLAELECGAKIDINLDVLRSPHDGHRGADYSPQSAAVGIITRGGPHRAALVCQTGADRQYAPGAALLRRDRPGLPVDQHPQPVLPHRAIQGLPRPRPAQRGRDRRGTQGAAGSPRKPAVTGRLPQGSQGPRRTLGGGVPGRADHRGRQLPPTPQPFPRRRTAGHGRLIADLNISSDVYLLAMQSDGFLECGWRAGPVTAGRALLPAATRLEQHVRCVGGGRGQHSKWVGPGR